MSGDRSPTIVAESELGSPPKVHTVSSPRVLQPTTGSSAVSAPLHSTAAAAAAATEAIADVEERGHKHRHHRHRRKKSSSSSSDADGEKKSPSSSSSSATAQQQLQQQLKRRGAKVMPDDGSGGVGTGGPEDGSGTTTSDASSAKSSPTLSAHDGAEGMPRMPVFAGLADAAIAAGVGAGPTAGERQRARSHSDLSGSRTPPAKAAAAARSSGAAVRSPSPGSSSGLSGQPRSPPPRFTPGVASPPQMPPEPVKKVRLCMDDYSDPAVYSKRYDPLEYVRVHDREDEATALSASASSSLFSPLASSVSEPNSARPLGATAPTPGSLKKSESAPVSTFRAKCDFDFDPTYTSMYRLPDAPAPMADIDIDPLWAADVRFDLNDSPQAPVVSASSPTKAQDKQLQSLQHSQGQLSRSTSGKLGEMEVRPGRKASLVRSFFMPQDAHDVGPKKQVPPEQVPDDVKRSLPPDTLRRMESAKAHKVLGTVTTVKPVENSPAERKKLTRAGSGMTPTLLFVDGTGATGEGADADDRSAVFDAPDGPDNIMFNEVNAEGRQTIRAGTLAKLVQYLTSEKDVDTDYIVEFLLTHRGFTTSEQLLDLLHLRYKLRRPPGMDQCAFNMLLFPIRLRCVNVLKTWITLRPEDFSDSQELALKASEFVSYFEEHTITAKNLKRLLEKAVSSDFHQRTEFTQMNPPPEPLLYEGAPIKRSPTLAFDDLHPDEVARQINLIEHTLWKAIRPHEFMNQAWMSKATKEHAAPNILEMIRSTNRRTNWVMHEILSQQDVRARAAVLDKFITVASKCLTYHNFNAVMEIFAALQSSAIHRLKRTWELLPPRAWDAFDMLSQFTNSEGNFLAYRDRLRTCLELSIPCVPYLGIYLTYLTFITDGNPNFVTTSGGEKLVNFNKWRAMSAVVKEILVLQNRPMNFRPVRFIQEYITSYKHHTEDQLYDMSLALEETRERKLTKDERAAVDKLSREIFREKQTRAVRKLAPREVAILMSSSGSTPNSHGDSDASPLASSFSSIEFHDTSSTGTPTTQPSPTPQQEGKPAPH